MSTEIAPVFKFAKTLAVGTVDLLESWLAGKNAKTRRGYLSDIGQFASWAGAPSDHAVVDSLLRLKLGDANRIVLAYRAHMVERKLSSSTINRRLAAIRSMVKAGRTIGMVNWSLEVGNERPEQNRKDMKGPDLADVRLLFRGAAALGDRKMARRDQAILAVTYDLDLRRNEVVMLDLADVEMNADGLPVAVLILGKGHREKKRLTLPDATGKALASWIESRGNDSGPLFHRCDGHDLKEGVRLSGETIRRIMARLSVASGLNYVVRPHGLRHAATTDALDSGQSVQNVQKFGRWASLDMVLRYEDIRRDVAGEVASVVSRRRQGR